MRLLIYYSYNHNAFKCKFGYEPYKDLSPLKIGSYNGFGDEYIGYYNLKPSRNLKTKIKHFFRSIRLWFKKHFGRKVVYIYVEKNKNKRY